MSKIIRTKFNKEGDMIYISHLDLQQLLQRAFRRAEIDLVHSQGFNPHPKISYGNALALGTESQGEYVDVEIEDESISVEEYLTKMNEQLPAGIEFLKAIEITRQTPSLASNIEYGEYIFTIELEKALSKEFVKGKLLEFMSNEEILITKRNKKGKMVESNIRPMIKHFDILDLGENFITLEATIATGSKANLNTNVFIPKILEMLGLEIDPLDVDILRRDLYVVEEGQLVAPM
ncbi:MAG: TIGR03936 family radical SAM-associated protein [Peptostreptococcaceae bacterium]